MILRVKPSKKYEIAVVHVKNLTYEQKKRGSAKAYHWAFEGRKYDYLLLILGMLLHLLTFHYYHPKLLKHKNRFICSKLISDAFYKEAGVEFSKHTPAGYVTPGDIAETAKRKNNVEIVMSNRCN